MARMTKDEYILRFGGIKPKVNKRKNKFNAQKTSDNDSKAESKRAAELKLMERAGLISDLQEQVWFELIPAQRDENGKMIEREIQYIADFVYIDNETGQKVVEDKKGFKTKDYIIKRKLMLYVHGIRIKET